MQQEKIIAIFDQQASSYDEKWKELAPINSALHLLTAAVLAKLPKKASILCVGAGTGAEILYLGEKFPEWTFTAVEPSKAMLSVLRSRVEEVGIAGRCVLHEGYLDSLPSDGLFDAATAFLVSQFILDPHRRAKFFQEIADRLRPEGILVSSDLAGDLAKAGHHDLLNVWLRLMKGNGVSIEETERMREAYNRDVAIVPPQIVSEIVSRGSFGWPVQFFQAGLIHAWYARRGQ